MAIVTDTSLQNRTTPFSSHPSEKEPSIPSVHVLGVRFHALLCADVLLTIDQFITNRRTTQITLANAYTVTLCQQQSKLQALINQSTLTLADGMSVVWGARWLGIRLPGRVAGPDLMSALCAHAEKKQYGIFLMGSSTENLNQLKAVLLRQWPNLRITGLHSPSMCDRFDESETQRILSEINEAKPDILFVGISAPKQEIWIAENLHRLNVPVSIGVGAAFDFLSGRMPRAPLVLQKIGFEWLYRLWREPRRLWKRYLLGNAVFLSLLLEQRISNKIHSLPNRVSS